MKLIHEPRRYGKTHRLATYCIENPDVIMLVPDKIQMDTVLGEYGKRGLHPDQVVTLDQWMKLRLTVTRKRLVIDDADDVLHRLIGMNKIEAVTWTFDNREPGNGI